MEKGRWDSECAPSPSPKIPPQSLGAAAGPTLHLLSGLSSHLGKKFPQMGTGMGMGGAGRDEISVAQLPAGEVNSPGARQTINQLFDLSQSS